MQVEVLYLIVLPLFFAAVLLLIGLRIEVVRLSNAGSIADAVAQLRKAQSEIEGKITNLQAAVVAGEDLTEPLAELAAVAQSLDDVVVDVPDAPADVLADVPVDDLPVES